MRRAVLWARRRPYASAMIAGMTLLFALGFAGILWQWCAAVAAQRATEVALYENRIALADRELSAGEPGRAIDLLDECDPAYPGLGVVPPAGPPPIRRGGTRRLECRHRRRGLSSRRHDPGDRSWEKGITIWEAGTRAETACKSSTAHNLDVTSLAFSSDGRLMVFDELRRGGEGLGYRPVGGPARAPGPAGGSSLGRRDPSR